jgi:glycosyltransferase involved in cell wall biosynthesis
MKNRHVLILGLFLKKGDEKSNIRTVEDRLAELFEKENVPIITSSNSHGRIARFADTVYTVIFKRRAYEIAIVPLFGTWPSFVWQEAMTRMLRLFKKKVVLCIHGGSIPGRVDKGAKRFYKALQRADVLVAPSVYLGEYFQKKQHNVRVIENPIDLSRLPFKAKSFIRPRIIWMRAFTETYNPAMAIRVAKRMADKFEAFQMVMAGKEGPLSAAIKKMAELEGLSHKIIFPGYINLEEKIALAEQYDIYINTNKIDNAPVSVIEFMALGLPVVSVSVGGMPYLIDHEQNGLLVNSNDDREMFLQICRLLEDTSFARAICCNAFNYAKQYDERHIAGKWELVLGELTHVD